MVAGLHANLLADRFPGMKIIIQDGLFRVAVPTFFIITGFYLERQIARQGAGWFARILSMWAIWTMVYAGWWFNFSDGTFLTSVVEVLKGWYHLWYLIGLIVGAGVFLVVRAVLPGSAALLVAAVAAYTVGVALQYAGRLDLIPDGRWALRLDDPKYSRNGLFFGFPFLTVGALIARHRHRFEAVRGLPFLLVLGAASLIAESALANHFERKGNDMYPSLLLVCPVLFLLVRKANLPGRSKNIAHTATCIFLLHPLFQMALQARGADSMVVFLASVGLSILVAPVVIRLNRWAPLL